MYLFCFNNPPFPLFAKTAFLSAIISHWFARSSGSDILYHGSHPSFIHFSTLKMGRAGFTEALVSTKRQWHCIPEDRNLNVDRHKTLNTHKCMLEVYNRVYRFCMKDLRKPIY
jgi:hypothetical protein